MGFDGDIVVYDRNGEQIDTLKGKNGRPYTMPYHEDEHYWVGLAGSCGGLIVHLPKGEDTVSNLAAIKLISESTYVWNVTENTNTNTIIQKKLKFLIESIKSIALRKVLKDWIDPGDPAQTQGITEDEEDEEYCVSLSVDDIIITRKNYYHL
jgi:hypothetical protein